MFSQDYNIITDFGISETGYDREVIYGINTNYKWFIFRLMETGKLPGQKFMIHKWPCTQPLRTMV